jgi:hypothetical protein
MLADPAGEYDRIRSAHYGEESTDILPGSIAENLDREAHSAIVLLPEFLFQHLHIVRQA